MQKKSTLFLIGALYLCLQSTQAQFSQVAKAVRSPLAQNGARFGWVTAIDGDVMAVGAYRDAIAGLSECGAVYIHYRNQFGTDAWGHVATSIALDKATSDRLGNGLGISGDVLVAGAPSQDPGGISNSGAAYIFYRNQGGANNWGQFKKLISPSPVVNGNFGYSCTFSGDVIAIGAWAETFSGQSNAGVVYLYSRNQGGADNWGLIKTIVPSDFAASTNFGRSVALKGDELIVGANRKDEPGKMDIGAAYIFNRNQGGVNNWGQVAKLSPSDGNASDQFGYSVDISGDYAVVGSLFYDLVGTQAEGAAYVYYRNQGGGNNWGEVRKLTATTPQLNGNFGSYVGISGNRVVVGANRQDNSFVDDGCLYVFDKNTGGAENWGFIQKLTAADAVASDQLGISVAIQGNTIVGGAYQKTESSQANSGAVYVFKEPVGLPIELSAFKGERINYQSVNLSWKTESELNNRGFEIQRMLEAKTTEFEPIAWVEGAGTSTAILDYQFEDQNAYKGVSHYRLKQVDFDGTESYSPILAIEGISLQGDVQVFPNPIKDVLYVRIGQLAPQKLRFRVYNLLGKEIERLEIQSEPNLSLQIPGMAKWISGSYLLEVELENGSRFSIPFVKK